jgi:hypothetical protein
MKTFDLNIETVLEDWGVHHAVREVIANALDEQTLTKTKDVLIFKDRQDRWHIRDYGRGLRYDHLTQNENPEKMAHPDEVIGKFGVGLKDALATFDRHHLTVVLRSKYGDISIGKSPKHGFDDITTLHALINEPFDATMTGTDVVIDKLADKDMAAAKGLFLRFSDETPPETTRHGQVLTKRKGPARIYITGVSVANEENFLFSYNITSITKSMKKALNRERTNVGRTAYAERIKTLLKACTATPVARALVSDLKDFETGKRHDELHWIDVAVHACQLLNATEKVLFLTPQQLRDEQHNITRAQHDGYEIITIPDNVRDKIDGLDDLHGNPMRDLGQFIHEWQDSFTFTFVKEEDLTKRESAIFTKTAAIFELIGGKPAKIKEILISETMRPQSAGRLEAVGIWEPATARIIIKRDQLKTIHAYAATLLHETAHARSGASDITEDFETELTKLLGTLAKNGL